MEEFKDQSNITAVLEQFKSKLYDLSARNPFINVNPNKLWFDEEVDSNSAQARKILEKQRFFLKEYGLETTLKIGLFLKWKLPNKSAYFCSPLLYKPAAVKRLKKIEIDYEALYETDGDWIVNPIIADLFGVEFEFKFSDCYERLDVAIETLLSHFNTKENAISVCNHFSDERKWELIRKGAVGTFNYKKSVLAKEFETVIQKPNLSLKQLLGFASIPLNPRIVGQLDWFPLDRSQKAVVSQSASNSIVVQGPPGTGKSHTIVAMLNHFVALGKKVLFVSEKKSALDVVYQRMGSLRPLVAYFDVEKKTKSSYYKSLKTSYEIANSYQATVAENPDERQLEKSRLYPEFSRRTDEVVGVSIAELESALIENRAHDQIAHSQSQIPNYQFWKSHFRLLNSIQQIANTEWGVSAIGELSFLDFNKAIFKESQPIIKIDRKIDELLANLIKVQEIQQKFELTSDWNSFTKLCLSASILNMVNQKQVDMLLPDTKAYQSFNNWTKKYHLTRHQLKTVSDKNKLWRSKPDIAIIEAHELLLSSNSLVAKLKRRWSHQSIFKYYQKEVPYEKGTTVLNSLKKEYQLSRQLEELTIKLKHNLNILHPDTEIDFIFNIRKRMESISHGFYEQILEKENHLDLIDVLAEQHQNIADINRVKQYLFSGQIPTQISELRLYLEGVKPELAKLKQFLPEIKLVLDWPYALLKFFKLNQFNLEVLERMVIQLALKEALKYQDYLKDLSGRSLLTDIKNFGKLKSSKYRTILYNIYNRQREAWQQIEKLCQTPNTKLTTSEKEAKKSYKQAKRIAIHEMNKTRQLMPVKNLYEQCSDLVGVLQPIWMMNPLSIAERLPLKRDMFDVVIFDESSQIPTEDAIPAIYRSKQMIIVGDSNQMPPSHFFSSNADSVPLLTEGQKYLTTLSLKWHYRSDHPDLIRFSNVQFYDNELKLFPALNDYQPIKFHYFKAGIFDQSTNQIEANAVATRCEELIRAAETDIAIIAMSKEQQKCIRKSIKMLDISIPDTVLIRNLESVQGIEKKHVLISIGYARNKEGNLSLNFGPINQAFGANRLNVLLSRAIHQMEIFTSLTSSDIGLSENRGVQILSQFLTFADNVIPSKHRFHDILSQHIHSFLIGIEAKFEYLSEQNGMVISAFVNYDKQSLLLVNPGLYSDEILDLSTAIAVLGKRFKSIKIVLNQDWLRDSEKVKKTLRTYFS